jgi:hypothetical protein
MDTGPIFSSRLVDACALSVRLCPIEFWIGPQSWSSDLSPVQPYLRKPKTLGFARFQPKDVEK